ncbi:Choline O-acetyltransferase [Araneus ventricosus]|uniref:Choline O-acetyltransferase n=1 Tax=Araneus ventricosus TaxID=182803 RepID=A0A4Y2MW12_ARAVE|nr:Choline O-acetyltransferase [Araneus ventricosus]
MPSAASRWRSRTHVPRVHRRLVSTYESASLRRFYKGRVDDIRAATAEALEWVKAMCGSQQVTEETKVQLFQACIKKQTEILLYTINGEGPDNHLLALREIAKAKNYPDLPIFQDKSYWEFLNFRLSTSQQRTGIPSSPQTMNFLIWSLRSLVDTYPGGQNCLMLRGPTCHRASWQPGQQFRYAMGTDFVFMDDNVRSRHATIGDECLEEEDIIHLEWSAFFPDLHLPTKSGVLVGYGPVVPDGYGCSYNPCEDHIDFCVSSFYSSKETSSDFFAHSLEGSLLNMGEICEKMSQMEQEAKQAGATQQK